MNKTRLFVLVCLALCAALLLAPGGAVLAESVITKLADSTVSLWEWEAPVLLSEKVKDPSYNVNSALSVYVDYFASAIDNENDHQMIVMSYRSYGDRFSGPDDPAVAREFMKRLHYYPVVESRYITLNGWPAFVGIGDPNDEAGFYTEMTILAATAENDIELKISFMNSGTNLIPNGLTFDDALEFIGKMTFRGEPVEIGESEPWPCFQWKDDTIFPGVPAQLTLMEQSAEQAAVYGPVEWTVTDRKTGEPVEGVSVSESGELLAEKGAFTENREILVSARYRDLQAIGSATFTIKLRASDLNRENAAVLDRLPGIGEKLGAVYYALETIPEEYRTTGKPNIIEEITTPNRDSLATAESELTYLSGDEGMMAAVRVIDEKKRLELDPYLFEEPEEVTFHLHLELATEDNRLLIYDGDHTLRAAAYEAPLIELPDAPVELTLSRARRTEQEIFDLVTRRTEAGSRTPLQDAELRIDGREARLDQLDRGDYEAEARIRMYNVEYRIPVILHLVPYEITGASELYPGQKVRLWVEETTGEDGFAMEPEEDYILMAEGNGAAIDRDGILTVGADAPIGETVTVTAARERDGLVLTKELRIAEHPLRTLFTGGLELDNRLTIPVPEGDDVLIREKNNATTVTLKRDKTRIRYTLRSGEARQKEAAARKQSIQASNQNPKIDDSAVFLLNGEPAGVCVSREYEEGETTNPKTLIAEFIIYSGDTVVQGRMDWSGNIPPMTAEDLKSYLATVRIDGRAAEITELPDAPEIIQAEGIMEIDGGGQVQYAVSEASRSMTDTMGAIVWSVADSKGSQPKGVSITQEGLVTVSGNAAGEHGLTLYIQARYGDNDETGVMPLRVYPEVKKYWMGSSCSNDVTFVGMKDEHIYANADPMGSRIGKLEWKADHPERVEWTVDEDTKGIRFTALAKGKVTFTATDENGKTGKVTILISDKPVTAIEVTLKKGQAKPGKTLNFAMKLTPSNPDNKSIYWTTDVGEEIATLDQKGTLKISKDAPAGTKITVTCTAYGAPEPLSSSVTVTVEE